MTKGATKAEERGEERRGVKQRVDEDRRQGWGRYSGATLFRKKTAVPRAPPFTEPLS